MNVRLALIWRIWDVLEEMNVTQLRDVLVIVRKMKK